MVTAPCKKHDYLEFFMLKTYFYIPPFFKDFCLMSHRKNPVFPHKQINNDEFRVMYWKKITKFYFMVTAPLKKQDYLAFFRLKSCKISRIFCACSVAHS